MTDISRAEMALICEDICDKCYWPFKLTDQDACDSVCAGCRISVNLVNLIERLEAKHDACGTEKDRPDSAKSKAVIAPGGRL